MLDAVRAAPRRRSSIQTKIAYMTGAFGRWVEDGQIFNRKGDSVREDRVRIIRAGSGYYLCRWRSASPHRVYLREVEGLDVFVSTAYSKADVCLCCGNVGYLKVLALIDDSNPQQVKWTISLDDIEYNKQTEETGTETTSETAVQAVVERVAKLYGIHPLAVTGV